MKKKRITLIVSVAAVILIAAHYKGLTNGLEGKIKNTLAPFGVVFSGFSEKLKSGYDATTNISNLQKENAGLKSKVSELEAKIAMMEESNKDNENLKKLLKFTEEHKISWIPAEIAAYDPNNLRHSVILNKGSKDGIKDGSSVISEGFLIGRITNVHDRTSEVLLVIDPESSIPVNIQGTLVSGLAKGQIGFGMLLDNVPQGDKFAKDDIVVTSGLGGDFPRGLIIGTIEEITSSENQIFQEARIQPAANFKNLRQVLILN